MAVATAPLQERLLTVQAVKDKVEADLVRFPLPVKTVTACLVLRDRLLLLNMQADLRIRLHNAEAGLTEKVRLLSLPYY